MKYRHDRKGNRIPDFSYAGYRGGGVALPHVRTERTVRPQPGDDTRRIQDAIDEVSRLPLDADGFRGAVLLERGRYQIRDNLVIRNSGVVLRGEGSDDNGTVLVATGNDKRPLIKISGDGGSRAIDGTKSRISERYVPVGARRFRVSDASRYRIGHRIAVVRPGTQQWIDRVGGDSCISKGTKYDDSDRLGYTCLPDPWKPSKWDLIFERTIVAIDGDQITIDSPVMQEIDEDFGGGWIERVRSNRIEQVGVEHLRGMSEPNLSQKCTDAIQEPTPFSCDEDHAESMVAMEQVEDAWVRDVTALHFWWHAYQVNGGSRQITFDRIKYLEPVSKLEGGRRYGVQVERSERVLVHQMKTDRARHSFALGPKASNTVFLDCEADHSYHESGPHSDWATATLFDNVRDSTAINIRNFVKPWSWHAAQIDSDHGWTGANSVVWNSRADWIVVMDPPTASNWVIGSSADHFEGGGVFDSKRDAVNPKSLYLRQLEERLGSCAVEAVVGP